MPVRSSLLLGALLFGLIAVLPSCKKERDDTYDPDATRGYYPVYVGRSITYDVDSILYNDFTRTTTPKSYQMRYDIVDTFSDNQGRLSYRVDVYERPMRIPNDTSKFAIKSNFYLTQTANTTEMSQNNLRFIKMVFPVTAGATWDGNTYIPTGDQEYQFYNNWNYRYSNVGAPYNNGRVNYENTVTVDMVDYTLNNPTTDSTSYAERTFSQEVYGYDAGMVYRRFVRWTYDRNPATNTFYRRGNEVTMRAVNHN